MSLTETVEQPQDSPPAQNRNLGRTIVWVSLAVFAFIVMALVVLAALIVLGISSTESTTTGTVENDTGESPAVVESSEPSIQTTDEPAPSTSIPASTSILGAPRTDGEAEELLLSFSQAWRTADWDQMSTFATDGVVTTAREWYSEGGSPSIDEDTLEFIFDSCSVDSAGATSCTVLYAPPEGFGLLFTIVYADNGSGLMVNELTFGGDAG